MPDALLAALAGALAGFATSIPQAGPVALLLASHGLTQRPRAGLALAAGAALAEGVWVLVAALGLAPALLSDPSAALPLRLLAAAALLGLGVAALLRLRRPVASPPRDTRAAPFLLGLMLVAANPGFAAVWTAVIAALGSAGLSLDGAAGAAFGLGAAAGVLVWFAVLLGLARRLGVRLTPPARTLASIASAALLVVAGLATAAASLA